MDPVRGGVADIDVDMVGYGSPADGYPDAGSESQSSGESYRNSSSSSSASDEPAVTDASIRNFCREVMEQVAQGEVSEAALQKYLTSMHALLQASGFAEEFRSVPASVHLASKWAHSDSTESTSVLLDICPTKDHYVFSHDSLETECPKCSLPRTKERQMMVGGVVDLIQKMFKVPQLAEVSYILLCKAFIVLNTELNVRINIQLCVLL